MVRTVGSRMMARRYVSDGLSDNPEEHGEEGAGENQQADTALHLACIG
jgi:hypothetical protein